MNNLAPVKAGLVGCGQIAVNSYMPNIAGKFGMVDVVKFYDAVPERAQALAQKYGGKSCSFEDMLSDPEIEIIINLTFPEMHYPITRQALLAGKHVYCEKMIAVTWTQALELAKLAETHNVFLAVAPDTFLGGTWQTARKAIDDGLIGVPISAHCFVSRGKEHILGADKGVSTRRSIAPAADAAHPPKAALPLAGANARGVRGSGLPYDMGCYYLHNLINLLGGVKRVTGFASQQRCGFASFDPLNTLYREPLTADREEDNLAAVLEFSSGAYASVLFSSGVNSNFDHGFKIYGTRGTLLLPDPNWFGGIVKFQGNSGIPFSLLERQAPKYVALGGPPEDLQWPLPFTHGYIEESRGAGLCDLAFSIRNGRAPRCGHALGLHAFEIIHGILQSSHNDRTYTMTSSVCRPLPLPAGIYSGEGQQSVFDN